MIPTPLPDAFEHLTIEEDRAFLVVQREKRSRGAMVRVDKIVLVLSSIERNVSVSNLYIRASRIITKSVDKSQHLLEVVEEQWRSQPRT